MKGNERKKQAQAPQGGGRLSNQAHTQGQEKKTCKAKVLITIKTWDDSSNEDEAQRKRRGHKHSSSSSSHMCLMAQGNIDTSSSGLIVMMMKKPFYELVQFVQFFNEVFAPRKCSSELKTKYANLKSNVKNCDNSTDTQQIKIINYAKAKLASLQEAYESLLEKMETLCKHNDEITKNVAKLEAIGSTLEVLTNEKSFF